MKKLTHLLLPLGITVGLCLNIAPVSAASLQVQKVIPDSALSIDGFGSTSNSGFIQAKIPKGSTIEQAYLYATSIWDMSPMSPVSGVIFHETTLPVSSATILSPNQNPATTVRWDVTSIINSSSSPTGMFPTNFSIIEEGNNDGAVLVVAYSNRSTQGLTSVILDGELNTKGDTVKFDFPAPYAGGNFLVSLASSYSRQPSFQYTQINVTTNSTTNRRLTTSAGGQDDGDSMDSGALITVGGIGDNPANPGPFTHPTHPDNDSSNPGPRTDDEYYNLALGNSANSAPFIQRGDTFVEFTTVNYTDDDNVFGMFINSKFGTSPSPVPEPSMTLGIFGIGGIGILLSRLGKKS